MKLSFVKMAGFRSFKDEVLFEFPEGFVVLTGRNGVGKSTVLDAVDFVLTGSINKYTVKDAKGGGLEEHIWWVGEGEPKSQYVSVGLIDENGNELVITLEAGIRVSIRQLIRLRTHSATWSSALNHGPRL